MNYLPIYIDNKFGYDDLAGEVIFSIDFNEWCHALQLQIIDYMTEVWLQVKQGNGLLQF